MLTLEEARKFYTQDDLSDEELIEVVQEIDCLQMQVLDGIFGGKESSNV